MDIIDRINERLAVIGKTGAEMSRDLGLSNSAYSQWNTGKTRPSKKTLALIAPYLKTSVEYLLTGKENPAHKVEDGTSDKEAELLSLFRLLPEDLQEGMIAQIKAVLIQRGSLQGQ